MSDEEALRELRSVVGGDKPTLVLHYLYFPRETDARDVSKVLKNEGMQVESRLGADGVNWLVLARHHIIPNEENVARARAGFEALATPRDGEYDGWEAEVE